MQIVILLGLAVILVAAAAAVQEIIHQEDGLVLDPIIIIEKVAMELMVMFELHILSLR